MYIRANMYIQTEEEMTMKLNKGWKEGAIWAPTENGKKLVVKYYVKANKRKSKYGIEGGKITGLILNTKDETLAYYAGEKGWVFEPHTEAAQIALKILMMDYN